MCDVDGHVGNEIESVSLVELVDENVECDQQIASGTTSVSFWPLPFESHLGAALNPRGYSDGNTFQRAHFTNTTTRSAALGRNLSATHTHRARTIYGKTSLSKRDDAATFAFAARTHRRTGRSSVAVTRAAFFVHFEFDFDLATSGGRAKRNINGFFDRVAALWRALTRTCAASTKHRRKKIAKSANAADVEILRVLRTTLGITC